MSEEDMEILEEGVAGEDAPDVSVAEESADVEGKEAAKPAAKKSKATPAKKTKARKTRVAKVDADVSSADAEQVSSEVENEEEGKDKPVEEKPKVHIPEELDLNAFQDKSLKELYDLGLELGLRVGGSQSRHHLVFEILSFYAREGARVMAEGVLEVIKDGFGLLRSPKASFKSLPDDIYVPAVVIRKLKLRPGSLMKVEVRAPRHRETFLTLSKILEIEGVAYTEEELEAREELTHFDKLTPLFPKERIILEHREAEHYTARCVDLIAPLGKGQRGLIVASPRSGKTIILKDIAKAIRANHPESSLIVLLLDERPEEVSDFEDTVDTEIYSSTFDESPLRHIQVAELVSERAKRLVERGQDVIILLDSITRLARGYNATQSSKGRIMSGGVEAKALIKPKKFFGAARNVEEGGSLTILATALVGTESRMDEVIFEEFKGTGNMEIYLDTELAERRIFPAIHTLKSGTRKDDLLYHPDEMKRVNMVRRQMAQLPSMEAMEVLLKTIQLTGSNAELLMKGLKV